MGEYGAATLTVTDSSGLLKTAQNSTVWMSHRDKVTQLPPSFTTTATTDHCPHAAVACEADGKSFSCRGGGVVAMPLRVDGVFIT